MSSQQTQTQPIFKIIDLGDETIQFQYKGEGIMIKFTPECTGPPDLTNCVLQGTTSNGELSMSWSRDTVKIILAKYGDGEGGSITIKITRNKSFDDMLEEWEGFFV